MTDAELLAAIAAGDRKAFEELYGRFHGMVYAIAVKVLHSHEMAEDCVQEVFWKVWKKADSYVDRKAKVSTWLIAMARNLAIDKLREGQRRGAFMERAERHESVFSETADYRDPSDYAERLESNRALDGLLARLPDYQREALYGVANGMTFREIAGKFSVPLGTVKARIRRGLAGLRAAMSSG